jgi:hypothetical protein
MQQAGQVNETECRQLLDQINCALKEMPGGESNHYGAKDPQHQ